MCTCDKYPIYNTLNAGLQRRRNRLLVLAEMESKDPVHLYNFILQFNKNRDIAIFEKFKRSELYWGIHGDALFDDDTDDVQRELKQNFVSVEDGPVQCRHCGKNKVISFNKATRSADEPVTVFSKCVNCNRTWKQ